MFYGLPDISTRFDINPVCVLD